MRTEVNLRSTLCHPYSDYTYCFVQEVKTRTPDVLPSKTNILSTFHLLQLKPITLTCLVSPPEAMFYYYLLLPTIRFELCLRNSQISLEMSFTRKTGFLYLHDFLYMGHILLSMIISSVNTTLRGKRSSCCLIYPDITTPQSVSCIFYWAKK